MDFIGFLDEVKGRETSGGAVSARPVTHLYRRETSALSREAAGPERTRRQNSHPFCANSHRVN